MMLVLSQLLSKPMTELLSFSTLASCHSCHVSGWLIGMPGDLLALISTSAYPVSIKYSPCLLPCSDPAGLPDALVHPSCELDGYHDLHPFQVHPLNTSLVLLL